MEKAITTEIRKRVSELPRGVVVTIDTFPGTWPRGTVSKSISRLCREGLLTKHSRGVYSRSIETRFGKAAASELEVISSRMSQGRELFGGLFLYNSLGLTTQNPGTVEILNNISTYKGKIGNLKIQYRRIKPKITEGSKPHIELMEVLRDLSSISDASTSDVMEWIIDRIEKLPDERSLVSIAKEYPPRFRALLGALAEGRRDSLSLKLRKTIKGTSKYKVGNVSGYVKNPSTWGLSFETT